MIKLHLIIGFVTPVSLIIKIKVPFINFHANLLTLINFHPENKRLLHVFTPAYFSYQFLNSYLTMTQMHIKRKALSNA